MDKVKADIEMVKAQTAQLYVQMQALDPSEVRTALAKTEEFTVEDILDDQEAEEDWGLLSDPGDDLSGVPEDLPSSLPEPPDTVTALPSGSQPMSRTTPNQDSAGQPTSAAVLVVNDGKILIGTRRNREGICGPRPVTSRMVRRRSRQPAGRLWRSSASNSAPCIAWGSLMGSRRSTASRSSTYVPSTPGAGLRWRGNAVLRLPHLGGARGPGLVPAVRAVSPPPGRSAGRR